MRALVVYESMYGNTHTVAVRIGEGLASSAPGAHVEVVHVGEATPERLADVDLLVVGGPTHIHGMTSAMSRKQAVAPATLEAEEKKGHPHEVDADADGVGLRDWFDELVVEGPMQAAAFDTRLDGKPLLTGRASKGINKRLVHHGLRPVVEPESFLVDTATHLLPGEEDRAIAWGALVAEAARVAVPGG